MSDASISGDQISPVFVPPTVHKDMIVHEVLSLCPQASDIMAEYGLHCFSCSIGGAETMQQGCEMHGFDEETMNALIEDLNETIAELPKRPQYITITKEAAKGIMRIAKSEGYAGQGLTIVADAHGGFCMEFQKDLQDNDMIFFHHEYPDVRVFASPLTLWRIGGATIDFREDRFKLDLPEDAQCTVSCDGKSCACEA